MTRVLGIVSGKGGVGKTTVAVNLALALRNFRKRVILIDCNLSTPHLAYFLGSPDYKFTLNDVLTGRVDIHSALNYCDGIKYIPASLNLEDLIGVEFTSFKQCIEQLKMENVDFIILDSAPGLGRETLMVLDVSSEIIFVTTPFTPMVNDIIRCLEVVKELRGSKTFEIVLNMVNGKKYELDSKIIEKITSVPVIAKIPFDKNVIYSLVARSPLMSYRPNSPASVMFMQLAAVLTGKRYKLPMKFRFHCLMTKFQNIFTLSKICAPSTLEALREEIFIQSK